MDDLTLKKLQFAHVTEAVAGHCASGLGKRLARVMRPSRSPVQVRRWQQQVREMMAAADSIGYPPMAGMHDLRAATHDAATPAGLDGESLARVQETLEATGPLLKWVGALPAEAALLRDLEARLTDLTPVARTIGEAVDARGRVRDTASVRLGSLRATIEKARGQIQTVFDRLLKQQRILKLLQYSGATFHNDRTVLPLKAEHRGRVPGIVHRSSDSGATLFVEPAEAVELNNTIIRLRYEEHEEVGRILSGLSRLVHQNAEAIRRTLDAAAVLDLIAGKVRYARQRQAISPQINDDGVLDLHGARHPVLVDLFAAEGVRPLQSRESGAKGSDPLGEPRGVVPIDVRLGQDFDLLVITGPNTGGKTVTLKTIGLLAAMTQAGIPIPANEGTTLPVYDDIFIDVGDEQSIEQSLSTFSSHLSNILAMLKKARRDALVLIDELGAGTDPDEGAAIGWAILDELLEIGCSAAVTTHLGQLKAVAYARKRVDNASVEFDVESLKPTYVVRLGEPGNSNAIAIADRLGMSDRLVARARSHLAERHRTLARAIEGTLDTRRMAEAARKAALQARLEAERTRDDFERKARELEQAQAAHEHWRRWLSELRPGDWVYVETFGRCARVVRVQLHKQTALVAAGAVEMEVPLGAISRPTAEAIRDAAG